MAERIAFPKLPKRFWKPLSPLIEDVNEFAAAAAALGVNVAELRYLCGKDGSMWLDAARVMRLAKHKADRMKQGLVTVVGQD